MTTPGGGEYLYRDNGVEGKTLPVNFGLFATPVFYSSATAGITFRLHLIMTNKLTFYLFYSTLYDRILDCYWNIECNGKDEHLW